MKRQPIGSSATSPRRPGRVSTLARVGAGAALVLAATLASATPLAQPGDPLGAPGALGLEPVETNGAQRTPDSDANGGAALEALRQGRWVKACSIAADTLALQKADLDAAGVFGLCRAAANDRKAADSALSRVRQAETSPYYAPLIEGVMYLRAKLPEQAQSSFKSAQRGRPDDPLASYFIGEALHARRQDPQALAEFKAVVQAWPTFAPALTAAARLMATPSASLDNLKQARALAERATAQEPMNRAYWRLLAELCERTGQTDRAKAITLQWLTPPPLPKGAS